MKKERGREKKFCKEMTNRAWEVSPAPVLALTFHTAGEGSQTERSACEGPAALNRDEACSLQNFRRSGANERLCPTEPSGSSVML